MGFGNKRERVTGWTGYLPLAVMTTRAPVVLTFKYHLKFRALKIEILNETNLIIQALKIEIMWNKSYPPSLGPNYEGIKISITIKLTKADIEAKSSTDIAKSQNPIV